MKQYEIKTTNKFKKQLKRLKKQNNFDKDSLDEVINILASNNILPTKYRNHLLEAKKNRTMVMSCSTRRITSISKNIWFANTCFD